MSKNEGARYWSWYENGGFEAIASWLYQRDVSAFNPAATPLETEYKQMLIDGGMSTAQSFLVHIIKEGIGEFQSGVIGSPFYKVADRLQGQAPAGVKLHHAGIIEALQDAGWHNLGLIMSKQNKTKKQIWISPKMREDFITGKYSRSDLRNNGGGRADAENRQHQEGSLMKESEIEKHFRLHRSENGRQVIQVQVNEPPWRK